MVQLVNRDRTVLWVFFRFILPTLSPFQTFPYFPGYPATRALVVQRSPAFGVVVSAFAVDDAVELFQEFDFHGDDAVRGRAAAIHADALELYPVLDAVFLPVADLAHEPVGHGGVHHYHAGIILAGVHAGHVQQRSVSLQTYMT